MGLPQVTLYTRVRCHLCDVAKGVLEEVRRGRPFELAVVDVDMAPALAQRYGHEVPVITIDGRKSFKFRVDAAVLRDRLERASRGAELPELEEDETDRR